MATERTDPVRDLLSLRERIDHLFQDALGRTAGASEAASGAWKPPVDVWVEDGRYHLRVDLPGVAPDQVTLEIENGVLHVRGDRRESAPRDRYLRAERPHGPFSLAITLPPSIDPHGIEATQRDGVLTLALRRVQDERGGRVRVALK